MVLAVLVLAYAAFRGRGIRVVEEYMVLVLRWFVALVVGVVVESFFAWLRSLISTLLYVVVVCVVLVLVLDEVLW